MNKEKFIKSAIILMIGGAITKLLGMTIKIVQTRLVGLEGVALYSLIFPTFSLFMSMAQLSLPTTISKLVSEERNNNKKLVFSSLPIVFITNIILMMIIVFSSKTISISLLREPRCYLPILAIALVLPFEALSNLLRGYFFGKERMIPHVISHVIEQVIRLICIILFIPTLLEVNLIYAVTFLILVNLISEFTSILILLLFLPRNVQIRKSDFIPKQKELSQILSLAIPTTGSRLVGNIGYFLEPIIITGVLTFLGYSNNYILEEYGIISGFVIPLLLIPSFFTNAVSQALVPVISRNYSNGDLPYTRKKIKQGLLFSLLIGLPVTIFFFLLPGWSLNLVYHTTKGISYMKFLAPFFLFQYIETPLSASLQAMGKAKETFIVSWQSVLVRSISLTVFLFFNIGMWGFLFSEIVQIFFTIYKSGIYLRKYLYES
ncbi:MAG: oligosaccharide flippase family protein [Bacilli bacterium]|nr:oligosaccharide flippase family protein [Bacilli bacterium]